MRRVPLFIGYKGKIFAQVAVSALLDEFGVTDIEMEKDSVIFKNVRLSGGTKDLRIPVNDKGCMLINWTGQWGKSFKHIPYYKILELNELRRKLHIRTASLKHQKQQLSAEVEYLKGAEECLKRQLTAIVEGKICLVGLTATGTQDMGPIPLQSNYPLVGVSSNTIDTIVTQHFIKKAHVFLNAALFLLTAFIIGFGGILNLWKSLILTIFYVTGYCVGALLVFN